MFNKIVKRTLRVPVSKSSEGNSISVVRSLDAILVSNGFKLSPELFIAMAELNRYDATVMGRKILNSVKELIGAHVKHNTYFKKFPDEVPDTFEFWLDCLLDALGKDVVIEFSGGAINLLSLPKYGKYLHTYEEMAAVHEAFMGNSRKTSKVLLLGGTLEEEIVKLYLSLAESNIPLSDGDRVLLAELSKLCIDGKQPASIPMKENGAIVNTVRINAGRPLVVDTLTDILRLACHLSDGDVTLATKTKFKSFPRGQRRVILAAINEIANDSPEKLSDINVYSEPWKRLFERLHPWEYNYPYAQATHNVAMKVNKVRSIASRIESMLNTADVEGAINLYKSAPGMLYRNLDRLLRYEYEPLEGLVIEAVTDTAKKVPARILFAIREHLQNRVKSSESKRMFTNTKGKTWVCDETRKPLRKEIVEKVFNVIDNELVSRLPELSKVIIDPDMLGVALPKSNKGMENGFGIMPRGSKIPVCMNGENLRFFTYWKQKSERTDFDLSVLFLDKDFVSTGHASYTNLRGQGYKHSGDIVEAPNGASEFIDIDLSTVNAAYIVPQVYVYCGEDFSEVEESFFGFMERDSDLKGLPFEPSTVKNKSDIRGVGKISLPLVFAKQKDGSWLAFWMQMYMNGQPRFNRVEENKLNTTMLAKAITSREYLYMSYVIDLLKKKNIEASNSCADLAENEPVVYFGLNAPEMLPVGSTVYTLSNIHEIVGLFDSK